MNKIFGGLMLIGLLSLYSCSEEPGKKGILGYNDMKLVMMDIIMADEFAYNNFKKDSLAQYKFEVNELYQKVFALHKISQETFLKSFNYYNTHPVHFNVLMDSLQNFANRQREINYLDNNPEEIKPIEETAIDTAASIIDTAVSSSVINSEPIEKEIKEMPAVEMIHKPLMTPEQQEKLQEKAREKRTLKKDLKQKPH